MSKSVQRWWQRAWLWANWRKRWQRHFRSVEKIFPARHSWCCSPLHEWKVTEVLLGNKTVVHSHTSAHLNNGSCCRFTRSHGGPFRCVAAACYFTLLPCRRYVRLSGSNIPGSVFPHRLGLFSDQLRIALHPLKRASGVFYESGLGHGQNIGPLKPLWSGLAWHSVSGRRGGAAGETPFGNNYVEEWLNFSAMSQNFNFHALSKTKHHVLCPFVLITLHFLEKLSTLL